MCNAHAVNSGNYNDVPKSQIKGERECSVIIGNLVNIHMVVVKIQTCGMSIPYEKSDGRGISKGSLMKKKLAACCVSSNYRHFITQTSTYLA